MFSKLPPLDDRLSLVASMVRSGVCVADVGTDHAYLPVHLMVNGQASKVYASDINEGPLASARETVERCRLTRDIETILSDGLDKVPLDEVDDIIIAGMGGELIASIIDRASALKDPTKRLILQPMTTADRLRIFLYQNGFELIDENAVRENGHVYTVMCVRYTGKCKEITAVQALVGILPRRSGAAVTEYIKLQASRIRKKAQGLSMAQNSKQEANDYFALAEEIESLTGEDETFLKRGR